jgi:hypothetical protein
LLEYKPSPGSWFCLRDLFWPPIFII